MQKTWEETLLTCLNAVLEGVYRPARDGLRARGGLAARHMRGQRRLARSSLGGWELCGLVASPSTAVPVECEGVHR